LHQVIFYDCAKVKRFWRFTIGVLNLIKTVLPLKGNIFTKKKRKN